MSELILTPLFMKHSDVPFNDKINTFTVCEAINAMYTNKVIGLQKMYDIWLLYMEDNLSKSFIEWIYYV